MEPNIYTLVFRDLEGNHVEIKISDSGLQAIQKQVLVASCGIAAMLGSISFLGMMN